jgi:multisubunit Na+/H+ antiporter MnhG subunit
LIAALLLLTTPVASHAIGRAAYLEGERMSVPGSIDESGHHLADE